MKYKLIAGVAIAALISFSCVSAEKESAFTYTGLYKSLKTSKQSEFSQLKLNFLLLQTGGSGLCPTDKVTLGDGEHQYEVLRSEEGALLLPLDKSLKQDHAAIRFTTASNITCHLSMQIKVADFELDTLTGANLSSWYNQFEALYSTLAGWPGRYFMPEVTALVLSFDRDIEMAIGKGKQRKVLTSQHKDLVINREDIALMIDTPQLVSKGELLSVLPQLSK